MELELKDSIPLLADLLSSSKLSIFAGSGISVDSGLPTWDGFVDEYIKICERFSAAVPDELKFDDILDDAKKYKTKDVIQTISALKHRIKKCQKAGYNTDHHDHLLNKMFSKAEPNIYHNLIVSTAYNYILTTNYDNLLEDAADNLGYIDLLTKSYSYTDSEAISAAIYSNQQAIIHAHGKIDYVKLEEFVLTSDDYHNIINHNNGFRTLINTIFLSNSILFVGYGGSDPHFEDIITNVNLSLGWKIDNRLLPNYYLIMKRDKATPIFKSQKSNNRVNIILIDDYRDTVSLLQELQKAKPRV